MSAAIRVATDREIWRYGHEGLRKRGLLPPIAGGAPWAFVKGTSTLASVAGTTGASVAFASNVTAGNVLISVSVDKATSSLGAPTFSDTNMGNTWTATTPLGLTGLTGTASVGWGIAASTGACTPKVTWPTATSATIELYIAEFTPPGAATYGLAVDAGPTTASNATAGTTFSGPTLTLPTGANDLTLVLDVFSSSWTTYTSPWVGIGTSQNGDMAGYAINQGAGASTPAGTCASGTWAAYAVAFALTGAPVDNTNKPATVGLFTTQISPSAWF